MMRTTVFAFATLSAFAQTTPYPLETFSVTGTEISKEVILEMSGLKIGMPLNKAAIDEACHKLDATGFFQAINYHYSPAPNHGYALTLTLGDFRKLSPSAIDIPGVDPDPIWQRLAARYPEFDHKVPGNQAAQDLLAREIGRIAGVEVVTRQEGDTLVFEPPALPRVGRMSFTGNRELTSEQLAAVMDKVNAEQEYTDRRFRGYVELNLRRAYEEHGMYRVRFPSITSRKSGDRTMDVTVAIDEGPKYTLGQVTLEGDSLPEAQMLKAASFKLGQTANWTEIQNGIWAMERPVKRSGYPETATTAERKLDDQRHVLDVKVVVRKGPLYRFGNVSITGLPPDLEAQARKLWRPHPGDPYDLLYGNDFLRDFSQSVDFRRVSKYAVKETPRPDHVMDITVEFVMRG
jgi:outer membrane protein assembly factor BamA